MSARPKLTREQNRRVRELMQDEGHSCAAATAWVLAFEPASPTQIIAAIAAEVSP